LISAATGKQSRLSRRPTTWTVRGFGAVVALVLWIGAACGSSQAQTSSELATAAGNRLSAQRTVERAEKTQNEDSKQAGERPAKSQGDKSASSDSKNQDSDTPFGSLSGSNRGPISIQSDALALDYKQNTVLFSGHVHATQADALLTSNTLHVKYGKDFHDVQDMNAEGNVHISQGVRWCTSDHAVMSQQNHTVILTGSPICHDARDQITGTRITVHMDTGKSDVEGAKAVIFPQQSKTRDNETSTDHAK
jgi:lipopolysaccharide export system protein LptA